MSQTRMHSNIFTDEWFIANDYFPISLVPYGDWEITVIEHTMSDETVENDEGGEDNADANRSKNQVCHNRQHNT